MIKTDTIYRATTGYFFTPDGVGRVWYETLAELVEDTGLDPSNGVPVRRATREQEEDA